jgi:hypothetical protein
MRNRILAGLGAAALATAGLAAPANAVSSTTADLWVVHAIPGQTVDVYIDGVLTLDDFAPEEVEALADVPAGTYTVDIRRGNNPSSAQPILSATVELEAGVSYTAVAHLDTDGDAVLTPFVNDISTIPAGEGKITVRHTANVGAVDVRSGDAVLIENLANPDEEILQVPAATYEDINVVATGDTDPVIELGDVALPAGTNIFVHAFGPADDAFGVIIFAIEDLGAHPAGVPAGEPGLAQAGSATGLAAGVALLVALLAAAGVLVRRQLVGARR